MVALLEREHEDVETLALHALHLAWSHLVQRDWWCVVFYQPGVWTTIHGPFDSRNMAEKFTGTLDAATHESHAVVVRMSGSGFGDGNASTGEDQ